MRYFPAFLDIRDRPVLVVGGTENAARKVRLLRKAHARVVVVARRLDDELAGLARDGAIEHIARCFKQDDVPGKAAVIAATGRADVDEAVAKVARPRDVPVNVVDRPWACTFITPAIVDRDPLTIGISSAGAAPVLARRIREKLEAMLPARIGELTAFAESFRDAVANRLLPGPQRLRFWETFFDSAVADDVLAGREAKAREGMMRLVNGEADAVGTGQVAIVGAGPGDPDLLTFKAVRFLQRADVVVHDRLVNPEIVDYARRDAERIDVGKAPGAHAKTQDEINALLIAHARAGSKVVRLKGGDPFVFGRGGEEVSALRAANVQVELVPGITAATGCAAAAGIPLTHRDHAQAVTFVTGHAASPEAEPDWAALAGANHTLAIYMGVTTAERVADRLIAHGLSPDTPAAIVEHGTTEHERILPTQLAALGATVAARGVRGPAMLIIGQVAAFAEGARRTAAAAPDPARPRQVALQG
ncbi:uroporphyrinogen-III C-methyltransferase [Rhodovibrio sodomensis]|uniref:Uroporphyrinogen-III C-methyltransferase n=1 Tax=Rhodovibrio sodomensis TaxID=1088 RepID=A0ABS1DD20_9PROT|nr:siroheme synthase CysG [Rhodovibrio sodomensis]MBK1667643.1 uroporphyrinogen-III C-methyltransferase [Rhodovibrio sodomensis]